MAAGYELDGRCSIPGIDKLFLFSTASREGTHSVS
jgi:hypothetical protein